MMICLRKGAVRLIFIFFLVYLPLQYGAVGLIGLKLSEPWPAFVLPGFKNIYSTGNQVEVVEPRLYATWGSDYTQKERIPATDLFEGIQLSQLQGFLRTHFQDQERVSDLSPEARAWLRGGVKRVHPGIASPVELQVVWTRIAYNQTGTEVRIENETDEQTITIPL